MYVISIALATVAVATAIIAVVLRSRRGVTLDQLDPVSQHWIAQARGRRLGDGTP
jgi:hypothetical protein